MNKVRKKNEIISEKVKINDERVIERAIKKIDEIEPKKSSNLKQLFDKEYLVKPRSTLLEDQFDVRALRDYKSPFFTLFQSIVESQHVATKNRSLKKSENFKEARKLCSKTLETGLELLTEQRLDLLKKTNQN